MSNLHKPGQVSQRLQPPLLPSARPSIQPPRAERPVLSIRIGSDPAQAQTDVLNAIAMHIFAPEVERESQRALPVQTSSSILQSRPGKIGRSLPRSLARLARPFNRRSSSNGPNLIERKAETNASHDGQSLPERFIEDVRKALPQDIDSLIVESLGEDALGVFSRDTFPGVLASLLQYHEGVARENLYHVLVDVLSSKARSYVFNEMPIRVIKLPEIVFLERDGVVEALLNKLKNQPAQVFAETSVEDVRVLMYRNSSLLQFCHSVAERWLAKETRYIILSHTWEGHELTYGDFLDEEQRTRRSQSYNKLLHICTIADKEFGARYAWADTVCIDKSSSAELDESIRSMFAWYRNSHACLVYLARTQSLQDMAADRWFTRGWTLQELLAPRLLKFYNKNWKPLTHLPNDKKALGLRPEQPPARSYTDLLQTVLHNINNDTSHLIDAELDATSREEISQLGSAVLKATGISMIDIINFRPGFRSDLSKRMRWIARRSTTRAEDKSYCMMGIFGVRMSVAYGEGAERAFFRLFDTLLKVSSNPDLFLWAGKPVGLDIHASCMIPSSPECFMHGDLHHPEADFQWEGQKSLLPPREPITLTNVGVSMSVLMVPEVQVRLYHDPGPALTKKMLLGTALSDQAVEVTLLNDEWISFRVYQDGTRAVLGEFAFGVCNFVARPEGSRPSVPRRVWAIVLYRRDAEEHWRRLSTQDVVMFECATRFQGMQMERCQVVGQSGQWTGSEVGSSWKLPEAPEMMLQTMYL